ncbi:MAG: septum formation family protein [Actinomycetota bacterium]
MHSAQTAPGDPRPGLAIGGGVLAGVATLAVVAGILWVAGRSGADAQASDAATREIGSIVTSEDLAAGDCVAPRTTSGAAQYQLLACDTPHPAQVTDVLVHPDAGGAFPGGTALADWLGTGCEVAAEEFIAAPVLETTLAARTALPDAVAWAAGDHAAVCMVQQADASSLVQSVEGRGADLPRGAAVPVARLTVGDCFVPADGLDAYQLNSNSVVDLVSCDEPHNGVFFGRDRLSFGAAEDFPGQDQVGELTSERCAALFEDTYDVEAAGFNYRYWRPNQSSWEAGDRVILCSILDATSLEERFQPDRYDRFFDLEAGTCFNLGPEETPSTLRLDDQVRVVACSTAHLGEMIGSGNLAPTDEEPDPDGEGILQLAGDQCEQQFLEFVGVSPFDSEFGNFPFWYPNEPGWAEGDRRYACAFLEESSRTGSLESAAG